MVTLILISVKFVEYKSPGTHKNKIRSSTTTTNVKTDVILIYTGRSFRVFSDFNLWKIFWSKKTILSNGLHQGEEDTFRIGSELEPNPDKRVCQFSKCNRLWNSECFSCPFSGCPCLQDQFSVSVSCNRLVDCFNTNVVIVLLWLLVRLQLFLVNGFIMPVCMHQWVIVCRVNVSMVFCVCLKPKNTIRNSLPTTL